MLALSQAVVGNILEEKKDKPEKRSQSKVDINGVRMFCKDVHQQLRSLSAEKLLKTFLHLFLAKNLLSEKKKQKKLRRF